VEELLKPVHVCHERCHEKCVGVLVYDTRCTDMDIKGAHRSSRKRRADVTYYRG